MMDKTGMNTEEFRALVRRADEKQAAGDSAGALKDYIAALKEDPDDAMLWNNRGVALSTLGRYGEAIESYEKAASLRPAYWMAWFNLGKTLQKLGESLRKAGRVREAGEKFEKAIEKYDRALELNPKHESALNNKAVALRARGHLEEALECYDELLGANPFYEFAWHNKGHLLAAMGIPEEAKVCFDIAAKLNPDIMKGGGRGHAARLPRVPSPVKKRREDLHPESEPDETEDEETDGRIPDGPRRGRLKKVVRRKAA
jgi:Flp pilus assembly protein TadD